MWTPRVRTLSGPWWDTSIPGGNLEAPPSTPWPRPPTRAEPSKATLGSVAKLSSTFFFLHKSPSPQRKVRRRGGSRFPVFLIKCHLQSEAALSAVAPWGRLIF